MRACLLTCYQLGARAARAHRVEHALHVRGHEPRYGRHEPQVRESEGRTTAHLVEERVLSVLSIANLEI